MESHDRHHRKDLEAQVRRFREESFAKDAEVQRLEKELAEVKGSQQDMSREMQSRDAEITMQKELRTPSSSVFDEDLPTNYGQNILDLSVLHRNWRSQGCGDAEHRRGGGGPQQSIVGISDAEKLVSDIKSGSAELFARTELLEKNILIYQSHQTFKQLEEEYFSLLSTQDPVDGMKRRRDSGFSGGDADGPLDLVFRSQVDELKAQNFALRRRLEEVAEQVSRLERDKAIKTKQLEDKAIDTTHLADYIFKLFAKLESEQTLRVSLEKQLASLAGPEVSSASTPQRISKYTNTNSPCEKSTLTEQTIDEIMRLQAGQIQRYELYVGRLHQEIQEWLSKDSSQLDRTQTARDSDSVIDLLRCKFAEDARNSSKSKLENTNANDHLKIKELVAKYHDSEKKQLELRKENKLLRALVEDLQILFNSKPDIK